MRASKILNMCVCVCARARAHVCGHMRHGTAATAAYDDAEPRLDVCGETDDEAGGEDSSDQNRSGNLRQADRAKLSCCELIRASRLNMQDERSRVRAIISP